MRRAHKWQRGSIVARGGFYFAVFRDKKGKQRWEGPSPGQGFRTQGEARRRLNELLVEVNQGSYVKPKSGTFAEFAEEWLNSRIGIRGSTLSAYASIIRQHLIPAWGDLAVAEVDGTELMNSLSKKGLGRKTLANITTLANVMLGGKHACSAIKAGYTRVNPAKGIELPPREQKEIVPPTMDEVSRLLAAAREISGFSYSIILCKAFTGLRRGEILGLGFPHVDWLHREITVRQAVTKVKATDGVHKWRWQLGPVKSARSVRRIALTETILRLLSGLRETSTSELVFSASMAGLKREVEFLDPDYFDASIIAPIAAAAGLPSLRAHDLRHFFASVLIAQGESPKYICDQMGHSSIQVTFDTYGHLFPQARQDAARKLEDTLTQTLSSNKFPADSARRRLT